MKFKEAIDVLPAGCMVYIGFENGNSWCWIERAGYILHNMDRLDEKAHNYHRDVMQRRIEQRDSISLTIQNHKNKLLAIDTEFADKPYNEEAIENIKKIENSIEILTGKFRNAVSAIAKETKILKNWIPISEREVVETYGHDTEPGICIISEGTEIGCIWWKGDTTEDDTWKLEVMDNDIK